MVSYPIIYYYKKNNYKFKKPNHKLYVILEEESKYNSYNQINICKKIKNIFKSIHSFFSSKYNKRSI